MTALNKEQILNLALKSAQTSPVASSRQGEFDDIYELKKAAMLKERHWPFTLRLTRNLTATKTGNDLNFTYRYQTPPGTIAVLDIAANDSQLTGVTSLATLSSYAALQLGYAPATPEDRRDATSPVGTQRKEFLFINGILHSQSEVGVAIIQIAAQESDFSEDFTMALVYNLAGHFARSVKGNPALAYDLERQSRMYHIRALRPIIKEDKDISDIVFRKWLATYYRERYR